MFDLGREELVFDLTIDGAPEFFANGLLVHNSMDALRYALFARFKHSTPGRRIDGPRYDEING